MNKLWNKSIPADDYHIMSVPNRPIITLWLTNLYYSYFSMDFAQFLVVHWFSGQ